MKKLFNIKSAVSTITAGALIAFYALSLSSCSGNSGESEDHDHDHEHESAEAGDHDDENGLILLATDRVKQLGVETEEIQPTSFASVQKVSGEITAMPGSEGIVAARQSGIVHLASGMADGLSVNAGKSIASVSAKGMSGGDPNEAARVAYDAAKRELDRITPLHKEGIVTTREYNAVRQRVDEAKVAMGTSNGGGSTATAPISGVITSIDVVDGQFVESGQTIATISSNTALSLRADLPESSVSFLSGITGARFRPSYSSETIDVIAAGGKLISRPNISTASNGYIPVYFSLPKGDKEIISGTFCEVYLLGRMREGVISVSEASVSEQQGNYFVYVEEKPGHFEKRPVKLGNSDGNRREVLSGVTAGDKVVTNGMTYVRLAETSGVVPEGHSHNH